MNARVTQEDSSESTHKRGPHWDSWKPTRHRSRDLLSFLKNKKNQGTNFAWLLYWCQVKIFLLLTNCQNRIYQHLPTVAKVSLDTELYGRVLACPPICFSSFTVKTNEKIIKSQQHNDVTKFYWSSKNVVRIDKCSNLNQSVIYPFVLKSHMVWLYHDSSCPLAWNMESTSAH